jgi:hypothetical protein
MEECKPPRPGDGAGNLTVRSQSTEDGILLFSVREACVGLPN